MFADLDGDTLTTTATLADGTPLPEWLTFENDLFTIADDAPAVSVDVIITATDPEGLQATTALTVSVEPPIEAAQRSFPVAEAPVPPPAVVPVEEESLDTEIASTESTDSPSERDALAPPEELFNASKINTSDTSENDQQFTEVVQLDALTTSTTSLLSNRDNIGVVLANEFNVLLNTSEFDAEQSRCLLYTSPSPRD